MGIFSKRSVSQDEIDSAKREARKRHDAIVDRINSGTASREDKRVYNAGRTRSGRIK